MKGSHARAPKHATIREVAAAAGVSTSTVSRAFSRPELLSAATVERVQREAERLAYVPNQSARALSTGLRQAVALIVPDVANPFFPPLIRGVERRCDELGISVLLGDTDETADKETQLATKLAAQSDGVILAAPRSSEEVLRRLAESTPVVLVNRDLDDVPRVLIDSASGMRSAVEHLATLGHDQIAYASGPSGSWADDQRRQAVRSAARRHKVRVTNLKASRPTFEAGMALAPDLAASDCSAVIAFDDVLAQGIIAGLQRQGVRVPADLSVIGCDDLLAATTYPSLTAIGADIGEAGRRAVDQLMAVINSGDTDAGEAVTMDTHLAVRDSTSAPRTGQ
ncbi:LacI family DNA-binding transcriptional regulator [Propionibacteriaceae bacterium Y1700]|uniref:LacI family DNA-binding transcriptional regulator n=1 Tax=Microlunatus sp. Y1700 TaxID=3418487 RepID=UPI003DA7679C